MDSTSLQAKLSKEILREYTRLIELVTPLSITFRTLKEIDGTGGKVSVADVIAYQIGWGKCLISWYEAGLKKEMPQMPGDGFSTWDYTAIARHFYKKYQYDSFHKQEKIFHNVVTQILKIVEKEFKTGNLDKEGIWPWCSLKSGKKWSLSKFIKVNTSSPYKRAVLLIKKEIKKLL
ncbi:MAG: ClbS/DfsB family four-helix bundle protein [Chlamydiae bacterium]|nr:ClbS/DfsB family four-helix bundle protein [Chlamydiota bacterium]